MTASRSRLDRRSDALLVADSGTDPSAFAELYERHVLSVFRWLDRRMGWLAVDLTAETFTRAWLQRDRFRDERDGSALPWLLGIAGRLVADAAHHDRLEGRGCGVSEFATEQSHFSTQRWGLWGCWLGG
jgi:DNA-directed RNA polymerase specialized sigma24 family protein